MTNESLDENVDDLRAALQGRWTDQMSNLLSPDTDQVEKAYAGGCPQCIEINSTWVYLRMCLTCGQVGCCDSSPQTHAQLHWRETGHAVMRTIEPDEDWKFNYELNGYVT